MKNLYVYFNCTKCLRSWAVLAHDPEIALLTVIPFKEGKTSFRCPNFETCHSKMRRSHDPLGKMVEKILATDLHCASLGMGLPEEKNCRTANLKAAMVGQKITNLKLEQLQGSDRSIILNLTLSSGKVIHFATSMRGATIYKITKEMAHGK